MPAFLAPRTLLAATLVTAIAALETGCILACNDIGCGGGFEWYGKATDDAPLVPGTYTVALGIEDSQYTVECTVADTFGESTCTDPLQTTGDIEFSLSFSVNAIPTPDWDPQAPPGGFYLLAVDRTESDPDGSYSASRGPKSITIAIVLDGTPFSTTEYEDIVYVRDKAYRGDERCGYCDEAQQRQTLW